MPWRLENTKEENEVANLAVRSHNCCDMAKDAKQVSPLHKLAKRLDCNWPAIDAAQKNSEEQRTKLRHLFGEENLDSEDRSIIAFGSIARGEWTSGSDLDWTLLIDGWADPGHLAISQSIQSALKTADFEGPGPTGTFGSMTFSHEIIHNIGGENDSNRNTTRRILLLLESIPIAPLIGWPTTALRRAS